MSPKSETASKRKICLENVERRMNFPGCAEINARQYRNGNPPQVY